MTLNERIKYAEGRRDQAIENDEAEDILFWRGYIQGLVSHLGDTERETRRAKYKTEARDEQEDKR